MKKKLAAFATAFLLAMTMLPTVSLADPAMGDDGATCTVLIEYVDETTGTAVADPYKAVLAPGDGYSVDSPTVDGYSLVDSSMSVVSGTAEGDETITVRYTPGTSEYQVNHYFETIDGTYVKDDSATQTMTAQRNTTVTATPLDRAGYECVTTDRSIGIPTDGTVVEINLYYDRTDAQEVIYFATDGSYVEPIIAAAGTDISAEIAERTTGSKKPTRQGYVFDGWQTDDASYNAAPNTMPDHSVTLTAKWSPDTVNYRVVYWCEHTYDHGKYYIGATDTRTGTVGDIATFYYLPEDDARDALLTFKKADENVKIAADGSTVLNVYYDKSTIHVIVYQRDWNVNPSSQTIISEQDLKVGDNITVPTTRSMILYFDDDPISGLGGTDPDTLDGAWGENITMRWTYYNPNVAGADMQSHMRYFSTDTPFVSSRGVDKSTLVMKVYPDYRNSRPYQFYEAYYVMDPNTNEYQLEVEYKSYRTVDGTSSSDPARIRPGNIAGYSLKYVRYSTETYPDNPSGPPSLGPFEELATDAEGNLPEDQWYFHVFDPRNYIAFYYLPNDYALNYIVNGETVHSENHPYSLKKTLDYVPEVPSDLAAQGYTFAGWYEEGDADQEIVTSTTINYSQNNFVAKFKAPSYTVTFDPNGGTMSAPTTQEVDLGAKATEPDPAPVREGYRFLGWFYQGTNGKYEFDKPVSSDVNLVAMWKAEPSNVTYVIKHVLDNGDVIKTENADVDLWYARHVTAFALDESDPAYPTVSVVPDAICKALHLPTTGDREIVFTYTRTPVHSYTVKYLDQSTGTPIASEYSFEDIAQVMTVAAPGISGYRSLQTYGQGDVDDGTITLYYAADKGSGDQGGASSTNTGVKQSSNTPATGDAAGASAFWAALLLGAAGVAVIALARRKREE